MLGTCRFCKKFEDGLIAYGTRHYAHAKCYLDAGKPLSGLHSHYIGQMPFKLLKERGLLAEADKLTAGKLK